MNQMTPSKRRKSQDVVRRELLDTALQLVRDTGDLSFSLRRLAEAAGTSTMAVYTHFGNREALCRALATRSFDAFALRLQDTMAEVQDADPVTTLRHMVRDYRRLALEDPSLFDLIFGDALRFDTVEPLNHAFDGLPTPSENGYAVYGMFTGVFETGMQQGIFRADVPARLLMDSFWAQVHGLVTLERLGYVRSAQDAEDRFTFGIDAILRGMAPVTPA